MANSSDWIAAAAAADPQTAPPGWLAQLGQPGHFYEAFGFAGRSAEPHVDPQPAAPPPMPDPATAALTCAFADGEAAGRAAALAEAEAAATRQRALRLAFRTLDEAARDALSHDLIDTVMALCDGALAGCAFDRDALLARCHGAARRIGDAAATLTLHLHPDDLALLGPDALGGWQIAPDAALERGGLVIESAEGLVSDGPAEWRRAIATAVRG